MAPIDIEATIKVNDIPFIYYKYPPESQISICFPLRTAVFELQTILRQV